MANQNQNRNQATAVAANRPSAVASVVTTSSPVTVMASAPAPASGDAAKQVKEDAIRSRMVEIPFKTGVEGYAGRSMHFDLSGKQAETLKQIAAALLAQEAKLEDGRRVNNGRMAIEWILEQTARS